MKYLPLYYQWMDSGEIDAGGLCNYFGFGGVSSWTAKPGFEDFELFIPIAETQRLYKRGYWAADNAYYPYKFGKIRQNIVLFLAAMNNEI